MQCFSYFTTPDNLHWEWGAILEGGIEFEYLGKTHQIYEGDNTKKGFIFKTN